MEDVSWRKTIDIRTGRVIDECCPEDVPDRVLHRELPEATCIRVEVRVKQAEEMFMKKGAEVAEVFSPPRVVHDAGNPKYLGLNLVPGWSLDLSVADPISGLPWDLSKPGMRARAKELVLMVMPHTLVCSPVCTPLSAHCRTLSRPSATQRLLKRS